MWPLSGLHLKGPEGKWFVEPESLLSTFPQLRTRGRGKGGGTEAASVLALGKPLSLTSFWTGWEAPCSQSPRSRPCPCMTEAEAPLKLWPPLRGTALPSQVLAPVRQCRPRMWAAGRPAGIGAPTLSSITWGGNLLRSEKQTSERLWCPVGKVSFSCNSPPKSPPNVKALLRCPRALSTWALWK